MGIIKSFTNLFSSSKAEFSSTDTNAIRSFFSGETSITSSNAQKISTVFACVNIKANAISVMPIKTYKRTDTGKQEDRENTLYNMLRYEPNPNLTASLYKKMISQDIDLRGNHYSQIVRNGLGQVVALYPLVSDKMEVIYSLKSKKRTYKYDGKYIRTERVLHIYDIPDANGLKGLSRIEYAKQTLEFANSASIHGNKIFKNSTKPSGAFETDQTLNDESYARLRENITE